MGEFLITRRGGSINEPAILNENYPMDVTVTQTSESATFQVIIDKDGVPAEYTYQWYVDGIAVDGANSASYTITSFASVTNRTVYCEVRNKAGTARSRVATLEVISFVPVFDLSGSAPSMKVDEENQNWEFEIRESGALKLVRPFDSILVDVFMVAGGGCGGGIGKGGGGGGYTLTKTSIQLNKDQVFEIIIGAGSQSDTSRGGTTSAFGFSVDGGYSTYGIDGADGGSGGGGGAGDGDPPSPYRYANRDPGHGGTDGNDGTGGKWTYHGASSNVQDDYGGSHGGTGQHETTRAFGEIDGALYASGGDGGDGGKHGAENSGDGGSAGYGHGGSGIVIVRNHREVV